jgi:hypothetical protein
MISRLHISPSFHEFLPYYLVSHLGGWFRENNELLAKTIGIPIKTVQQCKKKYSFLYQYHIKFFNKNNKVLNFHESFILTPKQAKRKGVYYTTSAIEWWNNDVCLDIDFNLIFKYYPNAVGPVFDKIRKLQ